MKASVLALSVLLTVGCSSNGHISVMTNPNSFLKEVKLGRTVVDVIKVQGLPNYRFDDGDVKYMSYEIGQEYGLRTYVYEFTSGKLTNVTYNDQGPFNGITAKDAQNL